MDLSSNYHFFKSFPMKSFLYDQDIFYTTKWLNLEFCSACNLRCKWCTLGHHKKVVMMSPLILGKVLDELSGNRNFKLERIDLHNGGEVLLHNNLKEMLGIVSSKRRYIHSKIRSQSSLIPISPGILTRSIIMIETIIIIR